MHGRHLLHPIVFGVGCKSFVVESLGPLHAPGRALLFSASPIPRASHEFVGRSGHHTKRTQWASSGAHS